jgi:hypothetical protein
MDHDVARRVRDDAAQAQGEAVWRPLERDAHHALAPREHRLLGRAVAFGRLKPA